MSSSATISKGLHCSVALSVLMLDEAHERTLYTDIGIGLLKKVRPRRSRGCRGHFAPLQQRSFPHFVPQIQKKRRDLRVIVASATLDAKVSRYA